MLAHFQFREDYVAETEMSPRMYADGHDEYLIFVWTVSCS